MDGTSIPATAVTVAIAGSGGNGMSRSAELRQGPQPIFASILPFTMLGLVVVGRKRRVMLVLLLMLIGTVLFSVNRGTGGAKTSGMSPGTYQVVVTGATRGTT